jgi:hypothetical protein
MLTAHGIAVNRTPTGPSSGVQRPLAGTVETSRDLGISDPRSPRKVIGNHGIPLAAGETHRLAGPIDGPERFFRIRFTEESSGQSEFG